MGDAEAEQGPPYSSAACGASRSRFAGARPVLGGLGSVMAMVQAQAPRRAELRCALGSVAPW